jgi:putative membrane protein
VINRATQSYCGPPVDPQELLGHWNLDPVLFAALIASAAVYWIGYRTYPMKGRACFTAGWCFGTLALISPLCAASVSLFAARIGQHLILTIIAAPLIAFGLPRAKGLSARPLLAALVFTFVLWFWEAPAPYAATFASSGVYWLMHISVVASAIWLWRALINGDEAGAITAAAGSMMQMSLLGALLTFAPKALYAWHFTTTVPYGLSALEDQQLGGILMWVPGAVPFLVMALVRAARSLSPTLHGASS